MRTLQAFAIVAAVAFWTFWAAERHAQADADQCTASLGSAARNVELAEKAVGDTCWGPYTVAKCAVAEELLASTQEQHAAALRLCPAPVAREYVEPFETDDGPFEPAATATASPTPDPAWCAVMGCE